MGGEREIEGTPAVEADWAADITDNSEYAIAGTDAMHAELAADRLHENLRLDEELQI